MENNDCAVRALAVACRLTYDEAHYRLQVAGRKIGRRTSEHVCHQAYTNSGLVIHDNTSAMFPRGTTVATFLALHSGFTGILAVRGHLIGVLNGVITNDWVLPSSARLVKSYYTSK